MLIATGKYLKNLDPSFQIALGVTSPDFDRGYLAQLKNRSTVRRLIVDLMERHLV